MQFKSIHFGVMFSLAVFSSCLNTSSEVSPSEISSTDSSNLSISLGSRAAGPYAAKFIFKADSTSGSFDTPSGIVASATRVFYPDGSLMANGTSSSSWPSWITSVEIGVSGASNTAATHPDCARFATSSDTTTQCDFDLDATYDKNCGPPNGVFFVSEYHCSQGSMTVGNGTSSDGVYIRITLDRDTSHISAWENLQIVMEYAVSNINRAPSDPTQCFTSGVFDPTNTNCSDQSWQMFLRSDLTSTVRPFLTMIPPAYAFMDTTSAGGGTGGSGVRTRSFQIPLTADSTIKYIQFSRINALSTVSAACNAGPSPNCLGAIFYSMSLYRM